MVQFNEDRQIEKVRLLHKREEESLAEALSERHGVPYLDLSAHPINIEALRIITEKEAHDAEMAVFDITDKKIDVAVRSPENDRAKEVIERLKARGYKPTIFMVSLASLEKVWDRYKDLSFSF